MTLEVFLPTLTDWDLSVRKSSSQLHRGLLTPRGASLLTKFYWTIVLNADLKSRNIRTWVLFFSSCSRFRSYTWPDSVSTCNTVLERGIIQASAGNNLMLTFYR
ncbi:hypothetical protein CHARACLAT_032691 [Characodon lateralis]|uniref:Uncharacterized protein n=1 Tax=Characodon lateralis TaxID=208331 RepID=A0ABU7DCM0_9TELE|nr:hypothetical protein [Characodon lateralis]